MKVVSGARNLCIEVARTPKKTQPQILALLARLGAEVAKRRRAAGHSKQDSYAKHVGISRAQLGIIERGDRSYGILPLLEILATIEADPVKSLSAIAAQLDSSDTAGARALADLVSVLNGPSKDRRDTAINVLRGLRKDQNRVA